MIVSDKTINRLQLERNKLIRRLRSAEVAREEFDDAYSIFMMEVEAKAKSIPLNKTIQAQLLDVSRNTLYRRYDGCRNYAELWQVVFDENPDLIKTLERNFDNYLAQLNRS